MIDVTDTFPCCAFLDYLAFYSTCILAVTETQNALKLWTQLGTLDLTHTLETGTLASL